MRKEEAFTQMIKEHEGVIFKITSVYTNNTSDQKDLYQEIVYQLWKGYDSFRGDSKISTWMYRVALNTAFTHIRKDKRRGHAVPLEHIDLSYEVHDPILEERLKQLYKQIKLLSDLEKGLILLLLEGKKIRSDCRYYWFITYKCGNTHISHKTKIKKTNDKLLIIMELEEMQAAWSQMSDQLETQKKLTNDIILKMTQQAYKNQWNRIALPEKIGTIICYSALILLAINFRMLDSLPLQIAGIICALTLAFLPIVSLRTIRAMKRIDVSKNNYKQTMESYAKEKKRFVRFQKINVVISFIFMFATLPVFSKLFNDRDFFEAFNLKLLYILPFVILFFFLLVAFVSKCYKGALRRSDAILEELKE